MRRMITALAAAALWAIPAAGQVKVEWKLKEGDVFHVEDTQETDTVVMVMGQNQNQKQKIVTVSAYKVLKAGAGGYTIERKIESIESKSGNPVEAAMLEKLKGTAMTAHLDSDMKVTKLEGYEKTIDALVGDNPALAPIMKASMSEEVFKLAFAGVFSMYLPGKPVGPGDKWTKNMDTPLGPMGTMKMDMEYTFGGVDVADGRTLAKLPFTAKGSYQAPKPGGPIPISKGELKIDDAKGSVWFDTSMGRFTKSESSMSMSGSLTIAAGGQEITLEMTAKSTQSSKLIEKP